MYKFRKKTHEEWGCCPMGTNKANNTIDCYYYGLVTMSFCNNCDVRKDKKKIKK